MVGHISGRLNKEITKEQHLLLYQPKYRATQNYSIVVGDIVLCILLVCGTYCCNLLRILMHYKSSVLRIHHFDLAIHLLCIQFACMCGGVGKLNMSSHEVKTYIPNFGWVVVLPRHRGF